MGNYNNKIITAANSGFAKVAGQRTLSDASQPPSQSRKTLLAILRQTTK
jgi:hypothetical protein